MTTAASPFNEDIPKLKASELETMIGKEVGVSKWIVIDQKKIDTFAELTNDTYFIHTDPVRAKQETPFGGTIAHGFLTLSLLSAFAYDALPDIDGRVMGMNYGFDKIRFILPVACGSKIRGRFKLSEVTRKSDRELVLRYAVSVRSKEGEAGSRRRMANHRLLRLNPQQGQN